MPCAKSNQFSIDLADGIDNLLRRCARVEQGQRLLIIGESGKDTYFDSELCVDLKQAADELGAITTLVYAEPVAEISCAAKSLMQKMVDADAVIFLSRLGDQTRFLTSPGPDRKISCYTVTRRHMGSPFAAIDHERMTQMLHLLESRIRDAAHYRIAAPCGTDLCGEIGRDGTDSPTTKFHVELFPAMTFEPINCRNLSGNLTISRFITSSSTRAYENSALIIESPVAARVKDSVIADLDGDSETVKTIDRQLKRVAELSQGDPYALHSWHTGINPGTFFEGDPLADLERWGTVAYGSPRYTHIHGAGINPGDAAFHIFDATIWMDDAMYWHEGCFVFLDTPEVQSLFTAGERQIINTRYRLNIGI